VIINIKTPPCWTKDIISLKWKIKQHTHKSNARIQSCWENVSVSSPRWLETFANIEIKEDSNNSPWNIILLI
jgi:hypothetical protein